MGFLAWLFSDDDKPRRPPAARKAPGRPPALRYVRPWDQKARRYHPTLKRAWKGVSGCYVIRDRETHRVLYVGESHTGALGDTATRHFRAWTGESCTFRCDRADVEVALVRTAADRARAMEKRLIAALDPREQGNGSGCDVVPF